MDFSKEPEFITKEQAYILLEANQILYGEDSGSRMTIVDVCNSAIEILNYSIKKQEFIENELGKRFYCQADAEEAWGIRFLLPTYWLIKFRRFVKKKLRLTRD